MCFMDGLYIEASKKLLTTSHLFSYTNVSFKMSKTDPRSGESIDAGSVVHRWGLISMNSDSRGHRDEALTFLNSYDVTKPRLLKSRDFSSWISAPV